MKSGQILSHIYSKKDLNIIFKFYTLVTKYISCLRSQSQHNGYKFRISGRGYVDGSWKKVRQSHDSDKEGDILTDSETADLTGVDCRHVNH